jgi:antitoxin component YwqK of YwqJK toxin-antitoxin module
MQRVPRDDLDYDDQAALYYFGGVPFTGVAFTRNDQGGLRSEMSFRDGLPWGAAREWYKSGQPMAEKTTAAGLLHGRAREWHKNGQLAEDGEFEHGIAVWKKAWDEDGHLVDEYRVQEADPDYQTLLENRRRDNPPA